MKIPMKMRRGQNIKTETIRVTDEIVDALSGLRPIAGKGVRISEQPGGVVLEMRSLPGNASSGGGAEKEPGGGYNGYFKIVDASETDENGSVTRKIKVVDGATYNKDSGSGGDSICKVNNVEYKVAPYTSGAISNSGCVIALKYTPYSDGQMARVELICVTGSSSGLPSDTAKNAYLRLGRAIILDNKMTIQQDHVVGVAQIYWYMSCSEVVL